MLSIGCIPKVCPTTQPPEYVSRAASCIYSSGVNVWECGTSVFRFTPVCWVVIAIRVSTRPLRLLNPRGSYPYPEPTELLDFHSTVAHSWGLLLAHHLIPYGAHWNRVLRGMFYSLMMLIICLLELVSLAHIWWSRLGLWFLGAREFMHCVKCIRAASICRYALVAASRLLPQWLRGGYSVLTLESIRGLEQKSQTPIDASWPSFLQVWLRSCQWL